MGTDVYGVIEVREDGASRSAGDAWDFLIRDYGLFGCLFRVRNDANFRPLFPNRGIPPDANPALRQEARARLLYDATFATYSELIGIDESEIAQGDDDHTHVYSVAADGSSTFESKATGFQELDAAKHADELARRREVRLGNRILSAVRLQRSDALKHRYLIQRMGELAARVGEHCVRLVVYFDS